MPSWKSLSPHSRRMGLVEDRRDRAVEEVEEVGEEEEGEDSPGLGGLGFANGCQVEPLIWPVALSEARVVVTEPRREEPPDDGVPGTCPGPMRLCLGHQAPELACPELSRGHAPPRPRSHRRRAWTSAETLFRRNDASGTQVVRFVRNAPVLGPIASVHRGSHTRHYRRPSREGVLQILPVQAVPERGTFMGPLTTRIDPRLLCFRPHRPWSRPRVPTAVNIASARLPCLRQEHRARRQLSHHRAQAVAGL